MPALLDLSPLRFHRLGIEGDGDSIAAAGVVSGDDAVVSCA